MGFRYWLQLRNSTLKCETVRENFPTFPQIRKLGLNSWSSGVPNLQRDEDTGPQATKRPFGRA